MLTLLCLCTGFTSGCARHGHTSISWMWRSPRPTFTHTVADWLMVDRFMSYDGGGEAVANTNAKATANASDVSLAHETSANEAEGTDAGRASLNEAGPASFFNWKRGMAGYDSSESPAHDPFLTADIEGDPQEHEVTLLPAPPGDDIALAKSEVEILPSPQAGEATLIGSIEDGRLTEATERMPGAADDPAIDRLRDIIAEDEMTHRSQQIDNSAGAPIAGAASRSTEPVPLDRELKFIRQRVESMLTAANEKLDRGLLDEAQRLCLQAQSVARLSPIPLDYNISPTKLMAEIDNRKTDVAIAKVETLEAPPDESATAAQSEPRQTSAGPDLEHELEKRDQAQPISSADIPRKFNREQGAGSSNSTEQWDVQAEDQTFAAAPMSPSMKPPSGGTSARLIANGSAHLLDTQISPTSLSVAFDEPQPAPSFLPPEWNGWDAEGELGVPNSAESEPAAIESADAVQSTLLDDISWEDERIEKVVADDDQTQWKLLLGLIGLLVCLSAASLLRHSRRNVPVAVPVDLTATSAPPMPYQG